MTVWVYILRCRDDSFYVGSHRGEDVAARVWKHNEGIYPKAYTYRRRPVTLLWSGEFADALDAIAFERRLKGWTRAKKQAFMAGDWAELTRLARSYGPRPSTSSG